MSKKKQRQQRPEDRETQYQIHANDDGVSAEAILPDMAAVSQFPQWLHFGVICHYARFHQPVPPYVNKEPVSEFKVKSDADKYKVDSIVYTPHGLIWTANGETNIVPLANVIYVRTIIS